VDVLIDDGALAALEARVALEHGGERLASTVELAWHLRQRNTTRAVALAAEAQAGVGPAGTPGSAAAARLALIHAEIRLLYADFDAAERSGAGALDGFAAAGDAAGCCDTWWLLARLATDRGDIAARDHALSQAQRCADGSGDPLRSGLMTALIACHAVFDDAAVADARWGSAMAALTAGHPALAAWAYDFRACIALDRSDHGTAIGWLREGFDAARRSGQIKKAIATAANIGLAFARLNDHGTALEWAEQALELARRAGWPSSLGVSLLQTAASLDQLDRPDAAAAMVAEALAVLAPLTGSFNYRLALVHQGELALKRNQPQAALAAYTELDERTRTDHRLNFRVSVLLGRSRALAALGRGDLADAQAREALEIALAGRHANFQIDALRVLAELHARFDDLPAPAGPSGTGAALVYLERAFEIAAGLPGYTLPADLLAFAAEQQARAGDPARAYALALEASAAREATHGRDARNRAIAMQVRHDTERARADSEHHRQLAAAETARAEALSETLAARERLTAERDETLAFLAHDLRAPLAAIVALLPAGAADAEVDNAPAGSAGPDPLLHKAARFAGRALSLTDRFLAMARVSRLPADARERLDLASVADEACETFLRRAFDEGKTVETDLVFGVSIDGSRDALLRALCNLIDNALRVTLRGGRVTIDMQHGETSIEIGVADTGPGLPPAAQAALRGSHDGAAALRGRLGLAIVAEVARWHDAAVTVATSPAGTRIGLRFATGA
jgi:signal transduction histidine kinase